MTLLANLDFSTGNKSQWDTDIEGPYGSISVVSSFAGEGYAGRFLVDNRDANVTPNPRGQLQKNAILPQGTVRFIGWRTYFPADFPVMLTGSRLGFYPWLMFMEPYGPPYSGPPMVSVNVHSNEFGGQNRITIKRGGPYWDIIWSTPLVRGVWHSFVIELGMSKTTTGGYIRWWYNGAAQLLNGATTLVTPTMASDASGSYDFDLNQYHVVNLFTAASQNIQTSTLYHAEAKVGTTFADVDPTGADTVAPVLSSASITSATLILSFNESLDSASVPATSQFAVSVNGSSAGVSSVAVAGSQVTLTLASPVVSTDTVTVSYTP